MQGGPLKAALSVNRKHMRGLVEYLRLHGVRHGSLVSLAPCSTTVIDGFEITNLPAYLLERVGSSDSA